MLQQLLATLIHRRQRRVLLKRTLALQLPGEVVSCVEELEEAADGIGLVAGEFNLSWLYEERKRLLAPTLQNSKRRVYPQRTLPSLVKAAQASAKNGL